MQNSRKPEYEERRRLWIGSETNNRRMCKMTEAVAFLLVKNGKFLAERRRMDKEAYPGMLAVPGGRMEQGESMVETLVREMQEEISVIPLTYGYFCSLDDPEAYNGLTIHYYWVTSWKGEILSHEAEEVQWVPLSQCDLIEVAIDRVALERYIGSHVN
jgi:8-oxo-dGTP diphosphatase